MSEKTLGERWWDSLRNVGNVARAGLGATEEGDAERLHVAATRALIVAAINEATCGLMDNFGEGLDENEPNTIAKDVLPDRTGS